MLLNITPDHLYWHMTFEAYAEAKKQVYANLSKNQGTLVIDAVCDVTRDCVKEFKNDPKRAFDYIPVGCAAGIDYSMKEACGSENAAFLDGNMLRVDFKGEEVELVGEDDLLIKGEHNVSNALAAAAAALACGVGAAQVREGLVSFKPLEHRLEPCGEIGGVKFVNDSKATNTDAVEKALTAFPDDDVILLLGGHDKGTPLTDFARVVMDNVRSVVCFGDARERFTAAMDEADVDGDVDIAQADDLRDAVDVARSLSSRGDVILLSPACSSFDEFSGYEERGRVFKDYVAQLAAAAKSQME